MTSPAPGAAKADSPADIESSKVSAREVELEEKLKEALARITELESQLELLSRHDNTHAAPDLSSPPRKKAKHDAAVPFQTSNDGTGGEFTIMALPDDLIPAVLMFLDPGLDWPQCRLVCRTWRFQLLSIDKDRRIWMGPLNLHNKDGWSDRLLSDLANAYELSYKEADDAYNVSPWRRTDVEANEDGFVVMEDWYSRPAIVSAHIGLCVRGAGTLVAAGSGYWKSETFSFAGAHWYFTVGHDRISQQEFGIMLHQCYTSFPSPIKDNPIKDKRRSDSANFCLRNRRTFDETCLVRYLASFTAGGITFKSREIDIDESYRGEASCVSQDCGYIGEYFPLLVAKLACGSPSSDLLISVKLDFLGYVYGIP